MRMAKADILGTGGINHVIHDVSEATPAEPRGEKKLSFVQILGGEKLLKFVEKWAVKKI